MKKILMTLAVVLVAGMTQAAAVQWNSGVIQAPAADGSFNGNIKGTNGKYLASVLFFSDAAGTIAIAGVANTTSVISNFGSQFAGTTSDSFTANNAYWAQMVITTTDNVGPVYYQMTSSLVAFTAPGTGSAGINFTTLQAMPGQWTVVPEPTSMALLALGIVALGLRRKKS